MKLYSRSLEISMKCRQARGQPHSGHPNKASLLASWHVYAITVSMPTLTAYGGVCQGRHLLLGTCPRWRSCHPSCSQAGASRPLQTLWQMSGNICDSSPVHHRSLPGVWLGLCGRLSGHRRICSKALCRDAHY